MTHEITKNEYNFFLPSNRVVWNNNYRISVSCATILCNGNIKMYINTKSKYVIYIYLYI